MRVNSFINTTSYYSPKFRGKEDEFKDSNDGWNVICEDPSTAEVRKWLREDYATRVLPYSFRYSKDNDEPNVHEHMLIHHKTFAYREPIKLGNYKNSYRGMSLEYHPEKIKELKAKGIETVISISGFTGLSNELEAEGMKYLGIDIINTPSNWKDKDYNAFADIISCMKKGNFYIGCMLGTDQTKLFLNMADYFVHPERRNATGENTVAYSFVETIMEDATPEQKERMGLTEEDEKLIKQRIEDEQLITYERKFKKSNQDIENLEQRIREVLEKNADEWKKSNQGEED